MPSWARVRSARHRSRGPCRRARSAGCHRGGRRTRRLRAGRRRTGGTHPAGPRSRKAARRPAPGRGSRRGQSGAAAAARPATRAGSERAGGGRPGLRRGSQRARCASGFWSSGRLPVMSLIGAPSSKLSPGWRPMLCVSYAADGTGLCVRPEWAVYREADARDSRSMAPHRGGRRTRRFRRVDPPHHLRRDVGPRGPNGRHQPRPGLPRRGRTARSARGGTGRDRERCQSISAGARHPGSAGGRRRASAAVLRDAARSVARCARDRGRDRGARGDAPRAHRRTRRRGGRLRAATTTPTRPSSHSPARGS